MENSEVKYVPEGLDTKPSKMIPKNVNNVAFKESNRSSCSVFFSVLALLIALVFFTLVFSWFWGVPDIVAKNKIMIDHLQIVVERQELELQKLRKPSLLTCRLPMEKGDCFESVQRWFMNAASGKCEQFSYSGCGGNANNFITLEHCQKGCSQEHEGRNAKNEPDCSLDPQSGPCRAAFRRFYFDSKDGQCKQFTYGGCDGNSNNFNSAEDCKAACSHREPHETDVCSLPQEMGPCRSIEQRWYFDSEAKSCQEFTFGGCSGNENNFASKSKCEQRCMSNPGQRSMDVAKCNQPAEIGLCRAAIQRFYFDRNSGKCEEFNYGGCGGNDNNFETIEECQTACRSSSFNQDNGSEMGSFMLRK